MTAVIEAAGCVLWRRTPTGRGPLPGGAPPPPPGRGDPGTPARAVSDSGGPCGAADGIELALVHRPKWADWSHPKGKLKRSEDARQAAVREVREETGMSCMLGPELPTVHYRVADRPKRVRYWAAEATSGAFAPSSEVDRMVWLPPEAARARLTRDHDKELVTAALSALRTSGDTRGR
jgi:8-oxo-dGTP diphosphatase